MKSREVEGQACMKKSLFKARPVACHKSDQFQAEPKLSLRLVKKELGDSVKSAHLLLDAVGQSNDLEYLASSLLFDSLGSI